MSNTSLKKIQVPALNHANFGKAIMEQFANIDANFQKLSNFELNAGIPGKSCLYVTINLMAPFVFPTTDINKSELEDTTDFNCWKDWKDIYIPKFIEELGREAWQKLEDSVIADYEQFNRLTSCSQNEYAVLAAQLLWGSPVTFAMHGPDPESESLTGALHTKYGAVEGGIKCKFTDSEDEQPKTYYGNWLWQMFKAGEDCETRASIFLDHIKISVPGRIIVAISPTDGTMSYRPVGSLEYWYIDPRFRNSAIKREDTNTYDMSCVMHWTPEGSAEGVNWPGHFEILEIFPTIRRGEDGKYYWFINGLNTGIPVQGPAGKDGTPAQLIVVQRIENVLGYDPIKYPNGRLAIGPLPGEFTVPMSAFAGDSPRNIPSRTQLVNDIPSIVPQYIETKDPEGKRVWTPWPINLEALEGEENIYNRTTSFKLTITSHDTDPVRDQAWLSELVHEGFVSPEPENLFRIYRLVGREILWKGFAASKIDDNKDPVNHRFDPSCDEYYFGKNNVSEPDEESSKQQLIELLDGATAIVLPGPAYQYDRTDTSYWITTLRKVEWHKPGTPQNSHTGRYMLVAYCSDEERIHNSIDDHTQAGMMQRLDAFTHKKNGDNRNKPRGLMLPIGSAYAAYQDGNFEWAWASHIIHSDCGGFVKFDSDGKENRRGKQQINRVQTFASDALQNVTGRAEGIVETQYSEVIGKRILHVGSVNDYRALNYVNNDAKTPNGGVPGREELPQSLAGKIGNADFFGSTVDGWFIGSELHVDEPVTITRYRDLHKRQRLLNVEGDVVIGPRHHVNDDVENPYIYRKRDGGLVVHSTISPDTGRDETIFPKNYNPAISIFNKDWFDGLEIKHREFFNDLRDHGLQPWKSRFGRWKYADGKYRALYNVDTRTIGDNSENSDTDNKRHRFSFVADDGIGARVFVAQDGIVVYNPDGDIKDGDKQLSTFSVDAQGNIQTTGTEVRSNADDTLWVFHSRWTGPENSYADMQKAGEVINWDWIQPDKKNMIFNVPAHNKLMIGTNHGAQFINQNHGSIRRLMRSWRATNFYPWTGSENTELCIIPMGWIANFGPLDDTGYHKRTFMNGRGEDNGGFGSQWGTNELQPVTMVHSADINHFYGTLHVDGLDCMAVRSAAKETSHEPVNYINGRYGSQIKYGLIVDKARGPIASFEDQSLNEKIFNGENPRSYLKMRYQASAYQENDKAQSMATGLGDFFGHPDFNMFEYVREAELAIWARGSIFASETIIADMDLVVNRAASIRAQARAKSFRRHNNSLNSGAYAPGVPGWAFLLDNGLSSYNAPRHTLTEGNTWPNAGDMSPIIIDLGPKYMKDRLMKLGYASKVRVKDNKIEVTAAKLDDDGGLAGSDRQICLFGARPDYTRIAQGNFNSLFSKTPNNNPGRWVLYSDGAFAVLQVNILLDYNQTIGHSGNMFRKNSRYTGYGINVPYSDLGSKKNDPIDSVEAAKLGVSDGLISSRGAMSEREGNEGGKARSRNMLSVPIICDAVSFDKPGLDISEDYLPILPVDEHVMAIRPSGNNNGNDDRWGDSWAGTDKDFQYGITLRLANVNNKLTLQIARAAGATMLNHKPNQTLSVTFVYPVQKFFDEFTDIEKPDVDEPSITQFVYYLVKDAPTTEVKPGEGDDEEEGGGIELNKDSSNYPFNPSDILAVFDKNGYVNGAPASVKVRDTEASADELASMLARLQSEADAKYIIIGTTTKDLSGETNPHINHNKDGVVEWSIYASKSDFESQGSGFAKRYVSTSVPFATDASNLETSWFAGKRTNNDFLSESIGVPGTIPAGAVQNSWDLTAEKAGGLTIITLRVAIDKHHKAGQKGGMAGLRLGELVTSKYEYRNIMTNAKLSLLGDSSIMPPKYDLLYFIPGMKANKTWHTDESAWSTGDSRAKGIEGDGDKQDETGIVFALKSTGEIEAVRAVNPAALCDPRNYSSEGGDQPYIMCRWVYPDEAAGSNSNAGLVTSKLYAASTGANADETAPVGLDNGSKQITIFEPTKDKPYVWVKTITLGKLIDDVNDPVWDNVQWSLSLKYSSGSGSSGGGSETSIDQNWSWQTIDEPTATSLKTWLSDGAREELLDNITNSLNGDIGDIMPIVNNYGQATIEKTGTNVVKVSLIVTAYKEGSSDLSHRSINFSYDSSGNVALIGTYIIGDSGEIYDDTALKNRIKALEDRPDNDTIYDDTALKNRIKALEDRPDNDTIYDDTALKNRVAQLEAQIGGSADADSDVTKLTTVDLGMGTISRDKSTFASHLKGVLQRAINVGSLNAADITASASTHRRFTLFGPGGYITFEFRGHENNAGTAWRVMVNGQISSNIRKSGSSDWAGCIMMFGTAAKFELSGNNVTSFDCDISCYYSNGPEPTYL